MKPVKEGGSLLRMEDGIFMIPGRKSGGCNVYVLKGERKVALVDIGMPGDYDIICAGLAELDLTIDDVGMVIITHEHIDHFGGLQNLPQRIVVAAHARTANKLRLDDEFSTMSGAFGARDSAGHVDVLLEDGTLIDLGGIRLRTIYTRYHTQDRILYLKAHQSLKMEKIQEAVSIARRAGVRVIAAVTDQKPGTEPTVSQERGN